MKRAILYAPAAIFTLCVIALNIILKTASPLWYAWVFLLWISGVIMNRGNAWGAAVGLLPAAHLIYMSTQNTGQVINIELPLGLIIMLYFTACGFAIWRNQCKAI